MNIEVDRIFGVSSKEELETLSLEVFRFQAEHNSVYKSFIHHLGINVSNISSLKEIPFLPINFFKTHSVISCPEQDVTQVFLSSATTGSIQSRHLIRDVEIYEKSYSKGFEIFYGPIENYCFLALLPSYQQRQGSSLIYMVNDFIKRSKNSKSGYFLEDDEGLVRTLKELKLTKQKTVLIGVTYALLDLVEKYNLDFPELIVMETGGMKGRRKEMVREELHQHLKMGFGVRNIHSEYGMTEMLGQAYALENGIFQCPNWVKVLIRDVNDPLSYVENNKSGGINVIDLSNVYSCSFISTQDLGRKTSENSFEVLGRFDHADIRGCNLLVQ